MNKRFDFMFRLSCTCMYRFGSSKVSSLKLQPIVLVHGGASNVKSPKAKEKMLGCKNAAKAGYDILQSGGSVIDAVEASVRVLEDDPVFNAGYGSVLNIEGEVEMDASIMVGSNLNAGAVTVVKDITNPISLARMVMDKTPHVLLAGEGALQLATQQKVPFLHPGCLITEDAVEVLKKFKENTGENFQFEEMGAVGAVAVDANGHVAAATSSGGITGKIVGSKSDSSQIGSGCYAHDAFGAVSSAGHEETILKFCLAHTIITAMKNGKSAQEATTDSIEAMTRRLNNIGGAITLSRTGEIGIAFSSNYMLWAYQRDNVIHCGMEPGQDYVDCP